MIHDLHRQGLSVSAIARKTGLDRKTVRKHLAEVSSRRHTSRGPNVRDNSPPSNPTFWSGSRSTRTCRENGSCARSGQWGIAAATVP
jgi:transposase